MKTHTISIINAITLILFGLWAYLSSQTPSFTALIPVFFGIALIFLNRGIKVENKTLAHIAVLLTILVFIGLIKPFVAAIDKANSIAIFRVSFMLLTTLISIIFFIKSFIAARTNK